MAILMVVAGLVFTAFVAGKSIQRSADERDRLETRKWMQRMEKEIEERERDFEELKKQLEDELNRRKERLHEGRVGDRSNGE